MISNVNFVDNTSISLGGEFLGLNEYRITYSNNNSVEYILLFTGQTPIRPLSGVYPVIKIDGTNYSYVWYDFGLNAEVISSNQFIFPIFFVSFSIPFPSVKTVSISFLNGMDSKIMGTTSSDATGFFLKGADLDAYYEFNQQSIFTSATDYGALVFDDTSEGLDYDNGQFAYTENIPTVDVSYIDTNVTNNIVNVTFEPSNLSTIGYNVIFFKDVQSINSNNYIDNNKVEWYQSSINIVGTNTSITNFAPLVNNGDGTLTAQLTIDGTLLDNNSNYRIGISAANEPMQVSQPISTQFIPEIPDTLDVFNLSVITENVKYDNTNIYTNAAVGQMVGASFQFFPNGYLNEAAQNGWNASTSQDNPSTFNNVRVRVTNGTTVVSENTFNQGSVYTGIENIDYFSDPKIIYSHRMLEEFAGQNVKIDFIFNFTLKTNDGTQRNVDIVQPFNITVQEVQPFFDTYLDYFDILDENGNDISKLCETNNNAIIRLVSSDPNTLLYIQNVYSYNENEGWATEQYNNTTTSFINDGTDSPTSNDITANTNIGVVGDKLTTINSSDRTPLQLEKEFKISNIDLGTTCFFFNALKGTFSCISGINYFLNIYSKQRSERYISPSNTVWRSYWVTNRVYLNVIGSTGYVEVSNNIVVTITFDDNSTLSINNSDAVNDVFFNEFISDSEIYSGADWHNKNLSDIADERTMTSVQITGSIEYENGCIYNFNSTHIPLQALEIINNGTQLSYNDNGTTGIYNGSSI